MAEGLAQNHLPLVADHDDRTGGFACADGFRDCGGDGGERLGQKSCAGGRSRQHDGGHCRKQKTNGLPLPGLHTPWFSSNEY
jgi:hypothetical protein